MNLRFAVCVTSALAFTGCGAVDGPESMSGPGPITAETVGQQRSELVQQNLGDSITLTADNTYDLYVDGALIADSSQDIGGWQQAETHSVRLIATDTIAVHAYNWFGVGGLLADVTMGGKRAFSTERLTWRCTSTYAADWYKHDFDDRGWPEAVEYGSNGANPWGYVAGISTDAKWIWTANANDVHVYCRARVLGCGSNVARGKTATANNLSNGTLVFDGDPYSHWAGYTGEWLQVDLGTTQVIGRTSTRWGYQTGASAQAAIEYFDSKTNTWKPMTNLTHSSTYNWVRQDSYISPPVAARYVRLRAAQTNGGLLYAFDLQLFPPCNHCERDTVYKRYATADVSGLGSKPGDAVDGTTGTTWQSGAGAGHWWRVDRGVATGFDTLKVTWGFDMQLNTTGQATLIVQGSNDGVNWASTPVATFRQTYATYGSQQTQVLSSVANYRYLRLSSNDWGRGWISDFQVLGVCTTCSNNLALNKPTTASSSCGGAPEYGVDGSLDTFWGPCGTVRQWWSVDLGQKYDLSYLLLSWTAQVTTQSPNADSTVAYWDDVNGWMPIETFRHTYPDQNQKQSLYFVPVRAQYIGFFPISGGVLSSLNEIQVCPL